MNEKIPKIHILLYSQTGLIYLPTWVMTNEKFPFQQEEDVNILLEGKKLMIEKQ